MANYYNTHLRKTSDPTTITVSKLERGMVIKMKYKKADKSTGNYIILVLQPKWPNTSDGKLHALSLNTIGTQKALELGEYYKEVLSESKKVRRLDIAKINIDKSSKLFYTSEIQNDKDFKAGYRTFDLRNIQSMYAVNYDWGQYDKIPPAEERRRLLETQREIKNDENKLRNTDM